MVSEVLLKCPSTHLDINYTLDNPGLTAVCFVHWYRRYSKNQQFATVQCTRFPSPEAEAGSPYLPLTLVSAFQAHAGLTFR